jgi:poly(A) polymerase
MKRIIKKIVQTLFGGKKRASHPAAPAKTAGTKPVIVQREDHTVSRSSIDEDAMKVLSRLTRHNHTAYLVGGGVRDLLLQRPVKDFDIATSAHPQEIKRLFRNCRLIGRRFRLAHILFRGGKVIEVSTFRRQTGFSDEGDLLIKSDNTFGSAEEDALRRDFTVNGLFYSITDFAVTDYVGGLEDLKKKVIRTIGDPNTRLREDPIRILRAIRLAARLGFSIDPATRAAMTAHRNEIWKSAAPRIVEEFVRMLNQGAAAASFPLLHELGVLEGLLPGFARSYARPEIREEVVRDLVSLDAHQKPREGLPPGLALAVLYYPLFQAVVKEAGDGADRNRIAAELLDADLEKLKFPRIQLEKARLLLASQHRLAQIGNRRARPSQLATKAWFADALTLFEITQADTPEGASLLRRWKSMQQRGAVRPAGEPGDQQEPTDDLPEPAGEPGDAEQFPAEQAEGEAREPGRPKRRRRRRGGRKAGQRSEAAPQAETTSTEEAPVERPAAPRRAETRTPPPDEDRPIDPDAVFRDDDTDLEPPGAADSSEDRTD